MIVKEYEPSNRALVVAAALGWPAVILASAVAVAAASILQVGPPLRPLAAFWFLLVCPGMAVVPVLPIRDRLIQVGFAVALSIGLDGVVSEAMLYTRAWSYQGALAVLIGICLIGTTFQIRQVVRRAATARTGEPGRG
jgi:hypothetical protein